MNDERLSCNPVLPSTPIDFTAPEVVLVLPILLKDWATGENIIWATDSYCDRGFGYRATDEIQPQMLKDVVRIRAQKASSDCEERTRGKAEVFTPSWICCLMNNALDEIRLGQKEVLFAQEDQAWQPTPEFVKFGRASSWQNYVKARCLEITCGEAPFLVSRYDTVTGEMIEVPNRIGLLDRKLRIIRENVGDRPWFDWVKKAYQTTYGYEFQGDNLIIARVNLLMSFVEYYQYYLRRKPTHKQLLTIADIISKNVWQMDGLEYVPPLKHGVSKQTSLFDLFEPAKKKDSVSCKFYHWTKMKPEPVSFSPATLQELNMKFDYIVGNPPYQEEAPGTSTSDKPVYHLFMDAAYSISDKVLLITPARFLFNAGATPSEWNNKMLNDEHFKVIFHEQQSSIVFSNTDIKGGIAITYHDSTKIYSRIQQYTTFNELNSILNRVLSFPNFISIENIIYTQNKFNLEHLNQSIQGLNRTDKRLESNIFNLQVFTDDKQNKDDLRIIGVIKNKRCYKYIPLKYIDQSHENLYKYKVILPKSNGSGSLGEVLSTPLIGEPLIGYTRTFIGIGAFNTYSESNAAINYIKSKFARTLLGVLKVTQDNNPEKWKYVPLQDFTENSDIDWSKSIREIDQQLYKKYGLDETEIEFIETHVKEMT